MESKTIKLNLHDTINCYLHHKKYRTLSKIYIYLSRISRLIYYTNRKFQLWILKRFDDGDYSVNIKLRNKAKQTARNIRNN